MKIACPPTIINLKALIYSEHLVIYSSGDAPAELRCRVPNVN